MTIFKNTSHDCSRDDDVIRVSIPESSEAQQAWVRCGACGTCIPVEVDGL